MKAKVDFETRSFSVPYGIAVKSPNGIGADIELPLCAFDGDTLERMCDEFRKEVFTQSGATRPSQCAPERVCPKCKTSI